jgi:hypothetical protein
MRFLRNLAESALLPETGQGGGIVAPQNHLG